MTVSALLWGVNFGVHKKMGAAEIHVDRTTAIGSPCAHPCFAQRCQDIGMRVPEGVAASAGDERQSRMHRG